jgi:hypothetical protein
MSELPGARLDMQINALDDLQCKAKTLRFMVLFVIVAIMTVIGVAWRGGYNVK